MPRVRPGEPVDQIAVEALQRLPVATGLAMRRLDGPRRTIPKTPRDQPPAELGIPGLAPDGMLRWTTPTDGWTDETLDTQGRVAIQRAAPIGKFLGWKAMAPVTQWAVVKA